MTSDDRVCLRRRTTAGSSGLNETRSYPETIEAVQNAVTGQRREEKPLWKTGWIDAPEDQRRPKREISGGLSPLRRASTPKKGLKA